jgi:hypothetical protein
MINKSPVMMSFRDLVELLASDIKSENPTITKPIITKIIPENESNLKWKCCSESSERTGRYLPDHSRITSFRFKKATLNSPTNMITDPEKGILYLVNPGLREETVEAEKLDVQYMSKLFEIIRQLYTNWQQ